MSAQAATHLMDTYIARTTPTLPMPHGPFEALAQPGHRFLVAREGLYLEARRRWLHAVLPLAASPVALPYGSATAVQGMQLLCNSIPEALLREFEQLARAALPLEAAAWVVWHETSRRFRLQPLVALEATATHLQYTRPILDDGWELVLDLHSHGALGAFFSTQDDADDRASGEVKLAGVVGRVGQAPEWRFRLAACGVFKEVA
ncbi:MAG: PRTRC system protein A [Zoogloea sp.]|nr:PRTRC system protein A [Zoogloea sp.]